MFRLHLAALVTLITACGPDLKQPYVGSWNGTATITIGTDSASKDGVVSVGDSGDDEVLVTVQMPVPGAAMLSSACAMPAQVRADGSLSIRANDCPPVHAWSSCAVTLGIAVASGSHVGQTLSLSGSGTVVGKGCGQSGGDVSEAYAFTVSAQKAP